MYLPIFPYFQDICEGVRKLISIIEDHREVKFPLAHYGLGKAYFKQNRYSVAGLRTEFMDQGSKLAGAGSPGLA